MCGSEPGYSQGEGTVAAPESFIHPTKPIIRIEDSPPSERGALSRFILRKELPSRYSPPPLRSLAYAWSTKIGQREIKLAPEHSPIWPRLKGSGTPTLA